MYAHEREIWDLFQISSITMINNWIMYSIIFLTVKIEFHSSNINLIVIAYFYITPIKKYRSNFFKHSLYVFYF